MAPLPLEIVKDARGKINPGLPRRMCSTHKDQINAAILAFFGTQAGANKE